MEQPERPAVTGKYAPLYLHLMALGEDEWQAPFAEIEAVLGFPLPRSARSHQPWWSNQSSSGSHSHAQAWQRAGWKARNVDLARETVRFQRVPGATTPSSSSLVSAVGPKATAPEDTETESVSGANADPTANPLEQLASFNRRLTDVMDEARRVLKRIVQSDHDLAHAAECAEQILSRDLHSATAREDKRLLRCINTALIVSYVRPFSGNRGAPDVRKTLPPEYLDVLSEEQRRLHEQLITLRDRDHAHSDPKGRNVSIAVRQVDNAALAVPLGRDAFAPLSRESLERVSELIVRLRDKLAEEQVRIQSALRVGEHF